MAERINGVVRTAAVQFYLKITIKTTLLFKISYFAIVAIMLEGDPVILII